MSKRKQRRPLSERNKRRIQEKRFKQLSAGEQMIAKMSIDETVEQYNLIKLSKSKLSEHLQKIVKIKIIFYIKEGKIKRPDLLKDAEE